MKLLKTISPYIVILGLVILVIVLVTSFITPKEISYTDFMRELKADNIKSVEIEDNTATLVLKDTSAADKELKAGKYILKIKSLDNFDMIMLNELTAGRNFEYINKVQDVPFVVQILPYILLVIVFFIF